MADQSTGGNGLKVLCVAAHPDDEVLGCGGALARHAAAGDEVHVCLVAEGLTSRAGGAEAEALATLAATARRADALLGARDTVLLGLPDNRLDSLPRLDVIQRIETVIEAFQPEVIYTHAAHDLNVDHQIVHEAVLTACRPIPGQTVRRILCFEVPSSSEWRGAGSAPAFAPNWFVDVSATLAAKLAALHEYAGEMRPWPHARSLEACEHLARWRGATVGVEAAEAFVLARLCE
jgi:LmbE family N-acetylglucosaminyl deacetylase